MKLLTILFFLFTNQYILHDKEGNIVGTLSKTNDIVYWKMRGYETEEYKFILEIYSGPYSVWYVEGKQSKGTILIKEDRIEFKLILLNKYHCNETYYR